jgi:hypothetical protein
MAFIWRDGKRAVHLLGVFDEAALVEAHRQTCSALD